MSLVELLRRGWGGATPVAPVSLRDLVETHLDFIGRSLRRLGVPEADVDDGVQQVFVVASRHLDAILPGRERSYLFGVALRVASDARRSRRRRSAVLDDSGHEDDARSHEPSPEALVGEHQARALLDRVLEAIPIEPRTVFILFELEEMTMAEIAQLLDLPAGTVASRLRRAREIFHDEARRLRERPDGSTRP